MSSEYQKSCLTLNIRHRSVSYSKKVKKTKVIISSAKARTIPNKGSFLVQFAEEV